jgi:parallel beta-helix repeat protein
MIPLYNCTNTPPPTQRGFFNSSRKVAGAILVLLTLFTFSFSARAQNTINVPADHATIQEAVNAASAGDIIKVAAGEYVGFNVSKSLTVEGPNAGIKPTSAGARTNPEAVINQANGSATIRVSGGAEVVIDGFKIFNTANSENAPNGISLSSGGTITTVRNNIFERQGPAGGGFVLCIEVSAATALHTIEDNFFTGHNTFSSTGTNRSWRSGVYSNGGNVAILNNIFEKCNTNINIDDIKSNTVVNGNNFVSAGTAIAFGPTPAGLFTLGNNNYATGINAMINLSGSNPDFRLDISAGTYGGTPFSSLPLTTYFNTFENGSKINQQKTNGMVYYVANHIYVRAIGANSNLQKAINLASTTSKDVIVVQGSNTVRSESVTINKPLELHGAQYGTAVTGRVPTNATESKWRNANSETPVITLNAGANDVVIDGFSLYANTNSASGIYQSTPLSNLQVRNNFVSNFKQLGVSIAAGSDGVLIDNNSISNNYAGIYFSNAAKNGTVTNNIISDHIDGSDDRGSAVVAEGTNENIVVENNFISNNGKGFYLWNLGSPNNNITFTNNSITGSGAGVVNNKAGFTLDATCNWWGVDSYSAIASKITGSATFFPFLIGDGDNGGVTGFQPTAACGGEGPVRRYSNAAAIATDPPISTHSSIQAAVNAAVANNAIVVDAGIYPEQVVINKSITLLGANRDIDPRPSIGSARTIGGAGETIISVTKGEKALNINADNVTINGFQIEQTGVSGTARAIETDASHSGIIFTNNIVFNTGAGDAMRLHGGEGFTISKNYFNNIQAVAIWLRNGNALPTAARNQKIIDNDIIDVRATTGGAMNLYGLTDLEISGNRIESKYQGISIGTTFDEPHYTMYKIDLHHNTILTEFTAEPGATRFGIAVTGITDDIKIHENIIAHTGAGATSYPLIRIGFDENNVSLSNPKGVVITNNHLSMASGSTGKYIYVGQNLTNPIIATCNWFGATNGAAIADLISGNGITTFAPWLMGGTNALSSGTGFEPSDECDSDFPVKVYDTPSLGTLLSAHSTIQAGVDAAVNGNAITVAAGTYTEAITVGKSLTIIGPNKGEPVEGPRVTEAILLNSSLTTGGNSTIVIDGFHFKRTDNSPGDFVLLNGGDEVTLQYTIFERDASGGTGGIVARAVVTSRGPGAKLIRNNLFTGNISGNLFGGHLTWNNGIYVNDGTGNNVTIQDNTFRNVRSSINIDDYTGAGTTVEGNTFENSGTYLSFGGTTPTTGAHVLGANDFGTPVSTFINLSNVATDFRLDITSSKINGAGFASLNLAQLFDLEKTMWHRGRGGRNGLVYYVAGNQYVAKESGSSGTNVSIQGAVDYAPVATKDIINIQDNTYSEKLVLNKAVKLVGQSREGAILLGAGKLIMSSNDGINLKADGVEITRLTVREFNIGIFADNTHNLDGLDISNVTVNDNRIGLYAEARLSPEINVLKNVTITSSDFSNNFHKGMYLERASDFVIDGVTVNNSGTEDPPAYGLGANNLNGIDFNLKFGSYGGIVIRNSTITNSGSTLGSVAEASSAIAIKARDDGSTYGSNPAVLSGVLIENNIISGPQNGIRIGEYGANINTGPTNVMIRENNLSGAYANKAIINSTSSGTVTLECNWHGTDVVGQLQSTVSGNVNISSYLTNGTDDESQIGFQPQGTCVDGPVKVYDPEDLVTPISTHVTIQAGVNAASNGFVVIVDAGTYEESVVINKPVDLRGAGYGQSVAGRVFDGGGETRVIPADAGTAAFSLNAGANNVSIDGFAFDGDEKAGVKNGIYQTTPVSNTVVANNFIRNFNNLGVSFASGANGFTVERNDIANNYAGVYFSTAAKNGTVTNNIFDGHGNGANDQGAAVVVEGGNEGVTVQNNTISNNGKGLYIWNLSTNPVDLVFTGNSVTGSGQGVVNTRTGYTQDVRCNWWGDVSAAHVIAKVGSNTTYSPWIFDGTDTQPELGFQPGDNACEGVFPVKLLTSGGSLISNHPTIQSAVDAASNGNKIEVSPGTYEENINVNKSVTLIGANAGESCADGRGPESIIVGTTSSESSAVTIAANGVTIDGFKITNPKGSNGVQASGRSNLNVIYNVIDDIGDAVAGFSSSAGIQFEAFASASNVNFSNNCISNVRGGKNATNSPTNGSAFGIGIHSSTSTHTITNLTVSNNRITNISANTPDDGSGKGAYGIMTNVGASAPAGAVSGVISHNTIDGLNGRWSHGVGLAGNTPLMSVSHNDVKNLLSAAGNAVGLNIENNPGTITANNNSFTATAFGIAVQPSATAEVDASCNWYGAADAATVASKVAGNLTYISWLTSGTNNSATVGFVPDVDVCNGTPVEISAVTSTDKICAGGGTIEVTWTGGSANYTVSWTGEVDGEEVGLTASPYTITGLTAGAYTVTVTDVNGSSVTAAEVTIQYLPVTNTTASTHHATIQAAIDAASADDVIDVCAGTYEENVTVNKNLTVQGPNHSVKGNGTRNPEAVIVGGVTISSPQVVLKGFTINAGGTIRAVQLATAANSASSDILVANNILDGLKSTGANFAIWNGSAKGKHTYEGNLIKDFTSAGWKVLFDGGTDSEIYVRDNELANMNSGVIFQGSMGNSVGVVEGNIFNINNWPAVALGAYAKEIKNNTFTRGSIWLSSESNPDQGANRIENNLFLSTNANYFVTFDDHPHSGNQVTGNAFLDNGVATFIRNSHETSSVDASCNWWGTVNYYALLAKTQGDVSIATFLTDGTDDEPGVPGFQPSVPCDCPTEPVTMNAVGNRSAIINATSGPIAFSSTLTGVTYSWSISDPSSILGLTETTGAGLEFPEFTPVALGTATVTVTPSMGGCVGIPEVFEIIVRDAPDLRAAWVMSNPGFIKPGALVGNATLRLGNVGPVGSIAEGEMIIYLYANPKITITLGSTTDWALTYDSAENYYTLSSVSAIINQGSGGVQNIPLQFEVAASIANGYYAISSEIMEGSGGETNSLNNFSTISVTVSGN